MWVLQVGGSGRGEDGRGGIWVLSWSWRDDSAGRALAGPATNLSEPPSQVSADLFMMLSACDFFFCCPSVLIRACGEDVRNWI